MEAAGFTPEEYEGDFVEVWPENWQAYTLFTFLSSQWRMGMGGPTGLDYSVMYRRLDDLEVPKEDREELINSIRTMEFAALEYMDEQRQQRESRKQ